MSTAKRPCPYRESDHQRQEGAKGEKPRWVPRRPAGGREGTPGRPGTQGRRRGAELEAGARGQGARPQLRGKPGVQRPSPSPGPLPRAQEAEMHSEKCCGYRIGELGFSGSAQILGPTGHGVGWRLGMSIGVPLGHIAAACHATMPASAAAAAGWQGCAEQHWQAPADHPGAWALTPQAAAHRGGAVGRPGGFIRSQHRVPGRRLWCGRNAGSLVGGWGTGGRGVLGAPAGGARAGGACGRRAQTPRPPLSPPTCFFGAGPSHAPAQQQGARRPRRSARRQQQQRRARRPRPRRAAAPPPAARPGLSPCAPIPLLQRAPWRRRG
jgi:hypothetical protein